MMGRKMDMRKMCADQATIYSATIETTKIPPLAVRHGVCFVVLVVVVVVVAVVVGRYD